MCILTWCKHSFKVWHSSSCLSEHFLPSFFQPLVGFTNNHYTLNMVTTKQSSKSFQKPFGLPCLECNQLKIICLWSWSKTPRKKPIYWRKTVDATTYKVINSLGVVVFQWVCRLVAYWIWNPTSSWGTKWSRVWWTSCVQPWEM